jgi:hypothetical protein
LSEAACVSCSSLRAGVALTRMTRGIGGEELHVAAGGGRTE